MTESDKRAALARLMEQTAAGPAPLAIAQERLWFLEQLEPGTALYTIPMTLRLRGPLDAARMEQAINEVVRRQGALRTTFGADAGGRPISQVAEYQPIPLNLLDLTDWPDAGREAEARRLAEAEGRRPFDLARGPLIRCNLYRLAPEEHWLQVVLHHIISDGISIGVIFQELVTLYNGGSLPDLPITYAGFARRQRERQQGGALEPHIAYWREKLGGRLPVLQLPTDRPRPAVLAHNGATVIRPISRALGDQLRSLARKEGATLFMTLLAAFQTLLYRYSRQEDITVGTPIGGRDSADVEGLVGLFVNTLVLRTDLTGRPTFRELLRRVRETALEAYAHQEVPFAKLVEVLHPDRYMGSSPLFQVMFALETSLADFSLPGLAVDQVDIHTRTAKFDISLHVSEETAGLRDWWEFNTELFDAATIERMAVHYETLLNAIVADPDGQIDKLNLLPAAELELVTRTWNETGAEYRRDACAHQLIEAQAAATPDAVAVICDGATLTYAELDRRSNQVARYLQALGVGPDSLVGVSLERSAELVVALLGVWKAGGAYVPMDPNYPPDRLGFMMADAQIQVLLTQERLKASLPAGDAPVLCIDTDWDRIARESAGPVASGTTPENLAYVIFTSGSTGRPKGVQVCQRGLVNVLEWSARYHRFGAADVLLAVTSISFDIAGTELYLPLIAGGKVVVATRTSDAEYLKAQLAEQHVTFMQGTPATWRLMLAAGWQSHGGLTMVVGGEPLPRDLADRLLAGGGALVDQYGPTETTVWSSYWPVAATGPITIGRPLVNTQIYILDGQLNPAPVGVPGELLIGGDGLARGYLNRPDLTAERFLATPYGRIYRTGDLARYLPNGDIEYLGRLDNQVKIRGFRIEPGEIEAVLAQHPAVAQGVVVARPDASGEYGLTAYYVPAPGTAPTVSDLRAHLKEKLPDYMLPATFMALDELPLTPSGKVDRRALPEPEGLRPDLAAAYVPPSGDLEQRIAEIWARVLQLEKVGLNDNFFDLGGHSLLLVQVHARLKESVDPSIQLMELFQYPTVSLIAARLRGSTTSQQAAPVASMRSQPAEGREIAIVGMAGRFPGAADVDAFWDNLKQGVCSLRRFSREELLAAGEDPLLLDDPNYVPVKGFMDGGDLFDAGFFAVAPREAETLDPQQRVFLEVAWSALENAGYDPERFGGRIGVFAGAGFNNYLLTNLAQNPQHMANVGIYQVFIANDKDFISTRTAYKLNLRGPAVTVQSACSTSLVAVHEACQSLLAGECEMALAGGSTITTPLIEGYLYSDGHIASPDGFCRAFDADAHGTVGGNGCGAVVLKRLADAVRDGDTIHAVIKATAINNDGSVKVGYTAPSVDGQAAVIADALAASGVTPDTIGYVEAHGTGTVLGDPIEIAGITRAYRALGAKGSQYCAIGSVKSNVGHLDAAAGVTGLIKATLTVETGVIPPSLNYSKPNPKIDFAASPFYVADKLTQWEAPLRRAGVSSFGIGGTNAHAIIEQAPAVDESAPAKPVQVLLLSARSSAALAAATANLSSCVTDANLADAAYTLSVGRKQLAHRRAVICRTAAEAIAPEPARVIAGRDGGPRPVAFLFPGQGAQYPGMARELYDHEPVFRAELDRCCGLLDFDLRGIIYPAEGAQDQRLNQTAYTQPALFAIEYAMAKLWMSWGVKPQALIGHSLGEYVAACLAGVFTLEDALKLVVARGKLIQSLPGGAMLAVAMPERDVAALLPPDVTIATINGPSATVVSGPTDAVDALAERLESDGAICRRLHTSHAFHSAMMDPILGAFESLVRSMRLSHPQIPFISNVTGTWITPTDSISPAYWSRHIRQAVRFSDGLKVLFADPERVLLEVGPGQTLSTFARQHPDKGAGRLIITSGRHVKDAESDLTVLLTALARLWTAGQPVDWAGYWAGERRRRIPLPTYPFERQRYWVEPVRRPAETEVAAATAATAMPETPAPAHERPADLETDYVAPSSDIETAIAGVWATVLGIGRVGVQDNFFDLGGDSLIASRVTSRLRELFPVIEVPLGALFQAPTVAQLAAKVEELLVERLEAMSDEEAAGELK